MKTKIFKSLMAMLAIAMAFAFTSCKEDETETQEIDPQIEISVANLAFTQAEETKAVNVTSNAEWEAEVPAEASWVTVTPPQGKGNQTVNVAVAANTTGAARTATVKFSALHPTYGAWDNKSLTISQSAGDEQIEELVEIFADNFDKVKAEKEGDYWPYFDAKYMNPQGSAADGVTYAVSDKNITVRSNSASDSDYSDYDGSGVNNIFFGKTPNKFVIENITLPTDKDCYVLTFGSEMYDNNNKEAVFDYDKFHVYVSGDNTLWSEVDYSFAEGDDLKGRWNDATASFKLAAVPAKLSIKFVAQTASVYRLDDVSLSTGGEGAQSIDLSQGVEEEEQGGSDSGDVKEVTVTEAISTAVNTPVKVKESTVVAVSARSYLLTDGTSYILAYKNSDPELAVGDRVTVEGKMGEYRNVPQIAEPVATKTGHDDAFKHPEATAMDGAAADAFLESTYIKYVKVEGDLVKSGSYWNLAIEGATKAQGSISYPTAEMCPDSYNGKKVAVYGYTLYQTRDTDVNVLATSIEVIGEGSGDDEPAEVKKVTVEEFLKAAEDNTVYELTGTIANVVAGKEYYGNFDLVDATGTVYIYGIKQDGSYGIFETLGLKAGDTITVQGNRGSYKDEPQMTNGVYISHVAGEGGEGGDDEVATGDFTSLACFLPKADDNENKSYVQVANIGGTEYSVLKLGTSSAVGTFTSAEVGVSGDKTLEFYAVAWKGKNGTLKISVDGTEVGSFDLKSNDGATNNPPYTITLMKSDYYTVELKGLKENSKVTFSTESGATRIIACGIKFTDGSGSTDEGGDVTPEIKEMTIAEVIAAAKDTEFKLKESTVVAISKKGLMLYDGANYIYAYAGSQPEVAVGDKVTVEGKKGEYNNMPQIANPVITKTGTDSSFAHPTAVEMNGAAIDAFQNDVKIQYVKVAGKLAISSGKYFNLTVEGATAQGSLDNPLDAVCPAENDGKDLIVYGYTLYTSSSNKYVNIITTSTEVVEPTPGGDDDDEDLPLAPSSEFDSQILGLWTYEKWTSGRHTGEYANLGLYRDHGMGAAAWGYTDPYTVVELAENCIEDRQTKNGDGTPGNPKDGQRYGAPYCFNMYVFFNIENREINPTTWEYEKGTGCYAIVDMIDRSGGYDPIPVNYSYFDATNGVIYWDFILLGNSGKEARLFSAKYKARQDK